MPKREKKITTADENLNFRSPSSARYLYFAYGSNLNIGQMLKRCPTAVPMGAAELPGWALRFRYYLDVDETDAGAVQGGLWACGRADVLELDHYEGCPRLYVRRPVFVTFYGRKIEAFVYTMTTTRKLQTGIEAPSPDYLRICAKGYEQFGLDVSELAALARKAAETEKRHFQYDAGEGRAIMQGGF